MQVLYTKAVAAAMHFCDFLGELEKPIYNIPIIFWNFVAVSSFFIWSFESFLENEVWILVFIILNHVFPPKMLRQHFFLWHFLEWKRWQKFWLDLLDISSEKDHYYLFSFLDYQCCWLYQRRAVRECNFFHPYSCFVTSIFAWLYHLFCWDWWLKCSSSLDP